MADWSQLPPELLSLIPKRLETHFDVLRFRSVCSSWRSSFPPKVYSLPQRLPSKTKGRIDYSLGHITRNTFFLVRLPGADNHKYQTAPACWLVKIRDGNHRVKMRPLNPLSDSELKPLRKVLDLTNFQVIELGHEFVALYDIYIDHSLEPQSRYYREKVAFMWSSSKDFMMLALFRFYLQYLAFFRSGEKEWTLLEDVDDVQDIISFKGKFYVIEQKGRTIVVDQSLNSSFLEHLGSPTSKKFLVQSGDNLLAVEMLFQASSDSGAEHPVNRGSSFGNNVIGFRIFRLDKEELKWDEMESLGDRILFLGLRHSISASASEFYWGKGNLIFYTAGLPIHPRIHGYSEEYYGSEESDYSEDRHRRMFVFDLDTGTASPLENCPAYHNLFWPPPEWVTSPDPVISSSQVVSNSTYSVPSATSEIEYKYPDSDFAISRREVRGKSPERATSAGQEVGCKRPSASSKCCFKFGCS
ncbi:hypothetical protein REPUB_Repub04eG0034200 [Reevesia pubescens]